MITTQDLLDLRIDKSKQIGVRKIVTKNKYRLIGSAPTMPDLINLIEKNWCWSISATYEIAKNIYGIDLKNHHVTDCRIVFKKGRYRLVAPISA